MKPNADTLTSGLWARNMWRAGLSSDAHNSGSAVSCCTRISGSICAQSFFTWAAE